MEINEKRVDGIKYVAQGIVDACNDILEMEEITNLMMADLNAEVTERLESLNQRMRLLRATTDFKEACDDDIELHS